jgi:hypothetical protein
VVSGAANFMSAKVFVNTLFFLPPEAQKPLAKGGET